jgi:hypothetical protein
MSAGSLFGRTFRTPCTIEIEHSEASLHAHLDLDGDVDLGPGDQVTVEGGPIHVSFGERLTLRRDAQVVKAGLLGRGLTRVLARLQLSELYEVSFTSGRRL